MFNPYTIGPVIFLLGAVIALTAVTVSMAVLSFLATAPELLIDTFIEVLTGDSPGDGEIDNPDHLEEIVTWFVHTTIILTAALTVLHILTAVTRSSR